MSTSWPTSLRAAIGLGRSHRDHRRARADRRRHHARRGRARARHAARGRRSDRRSDSRAVRAARDDDAGDQPAAGDGAARRGRARQSQRHRAGAVDRAWPDGDRAAAGSAARNEADARRRRSRSPGARRSGTAGLFRRVLKITGRAESDVDAQAQPIYGEVDVQSRSHQHDDSGGSRADRTAPHRAGGQPPTRPTPRWMRRSLELQHVLGPSVYSTDGRSLESRRRRSPARSTR